MNDKTASQETTALPVRSKMTGREIVDRVTTVAAIVAVPVILTSAHAADTVDIGTLALDGLSAAAAGVFAIKASPSLMMWGYRKILGFIGR